jgi:hypothetical protein
MAGITSAYCTSAKSEHYSAAHCFQATITPTGTTSNGAFTVTSLSSNAGIAVGMSITDTGNSGIPANAVVASIDSSSQITISKAATASHSGTALSLSGDTFKIALFKNGVAGTYGAATTNYSNMTGNSDECSGTGYSAGGVALTNTSPTTSSTTAYVTFAVNPSWTSSTFSTDGCMVYNSSTRLGDGSTSGTGRTIGVFSFGGTQTVSGGTFSVLWPAASSSTAIFRIA